MKKVMLLAIWISLAFNVKDDPFAALLKKLADFTKNYPTEKIHLHLDKPYYAIGDDIWFKAYLIDSRTNAPSTLSKITYVELIDERDSLIKQLQLPLENGISWGDFKLSDTLSEGNYRIRAYTQWMRNAGTDFFFDKTLKIGNSWGKKQKAAKVISTKKSSTSIDVQFFPEGGNLIQNLPNKIAFKAVNAEGKGEEIEGIIIDNEGTEITSFETSNLGMGSFSLNPMAGKTYRAKINEKFFNLPKTEISGYLLNVNNSDTAKIAVKVLMSDDLVGKGDLQLLAQQHGNVYFSVRIPTIKNFTTVSLPKIEFASGISTLTLFNADHVPVSERLIFVNNLFDKIKVDVSSLKDNYDKRSQVNLELMGSNDSSPTIASYSVAITNISVVKPDLENETNIFTSFLLKSELRGYIEKPNSYFITDDVKTRANLDLLLLTQGWRKINWTAVKTNTLLKNTYTPETDLQISGLVTTLAGKPLANGKVSLFTSSIGIVVLDTLTDARGRFSFKNLVFPDSTKFVITALNDKGKANVQLKLDTKTSQSISKNKNTGDIEVDINTELKNYLINSNAYFEEQIKQGKLSRTIQLNKVDIVGKKKKLESSSSLLGPGRADASYTAKDLKNSSLLSDFLGSKNRNFLNRFNLPKGQWPTLIVDGMYLDSDQMQTPGTSFIDIINTADIETVEILTSPSNTSIYGIRGGNGLVVITTKKGGITPVENNATNVTAYSPKGYAVARQFYSPRYDTNPDPKPDLRTTIYWNPHLVSDTSGKVNINFFNTDQAGNYRILIEGIDAFGNLAHKTYTYEVK